MTYNQTYQYVYIIQNIKWESSVDEMKLKKHLLIIVFIMFVLPMARHFPLRFKSAKDKV